MQSKHNKHLMPPAKQLCKKIAKENGIYDMTFCAITLSGSQGKKFLENILWIFTAQKPIR